MCTIETSDLCFQRAFSHSASFTWFASSRGSMARSSSERIPHSILTSAQSPFFCSRSKWSGNRPGHRIVQFFIVFDYLELLHNVQINNPNLSTMFLLPMGNRKVSDYCSLGNMLHQEYAFIGCIYAHLRCYGVLERQISRKQKDCLSSKFQDWTCFHFSTELPPSWMTRILYHKTPLLCCSYSARVAIFWQAQLASGIGCGNYILRVVSHG